MVREQKSEMHCVCRLDWICLLDSVLFLYEIVFSMSREAAVVGAKRRLKDQSVQ